MGIRRAGLRDRRVGEADVKNNDKTNAAVPRTRPTDRSPRRRGRAGRLDWRTLVVSLTGALLLTAAPGLPGLTGSAMADRMIQIGGTKRSAAVVVPVGKSEDVRTEVPFTDIVVGNPDIADVTALTDHTLSILGKKLGTTRVSIYGPDRKLIGVFDVEVSYDVSTLAIELDAPLPAEQIARPVGQRPHPAVRHGDRRRRARPGADDRAPVRPGGDQLGRR